MGRDGTHSRTVSSHPPRCHRACGFHRTRRPPERVSPLSFLTTSDRIPHLNIRQGRTLRHLSSGGPSPCTRLSRALTPMATLTPCRRIGGFLELFPTPSFRSPDHRLEGLPSSSRWTLRDRVGGGYQTTCTCYGRLLSGHGVNQVDPCHPWGS